VVSIVQDFKQIVSPALRTMDNSPQADEIINSINSLAASCDALLGRGIFDGMPSGRYSVGVNQNPGPQGGNDNRQPSYYQGVTRENSNRRTTNYQPTGQYGGDPKPNSVDRTYQKPTFAGNYPEDYIGNNYQSNIIRPQLIQVDGQQDFEYVRGYTVLQNSNSETPKVVNIGNIAGVVEVGPGVIANLYNANSNALINIQPGGVVILNSPMGFTVLVGGSGQLVTAYQLPPNASVDKGVLIGPYVRVSGQQQQEVNNTSPYPANQQVTGVQNTFVDPNTGQLRRVAGLNALGAANNAVPFNRVTTSVR